MESRRLTPRAFEPHGSAMQVVRDFRAVIALWRSARAFAIDIAGPSMSEQGKIWRRRNRVPRHYWPRLLERLAERGHPEITEDMLESFWASGGGR